MWDSIGCLIEWTDWVQTSLNLTRITVALAFLFGLAAAVSAVWPLVVDEWRKGRDRVAKAVFVAAAFAGLVYGGAKRASVTFPKTEAGRQYLVDRGSFVTNDYVHIDFERRIVPDDAALVIERRELASTNDTDWAEYVRSTFATFAVPTNLPCANATNWDWIVYADWTPPPSVHTNGVLEVRWGTSRNDAAHRAAGLAVGVPAQTTAWVGDEMAGTPGGTNGLSAATALSPAALNTEEGSGGALSRSGNPNSSSPSLRASVSSESNPSLDADTAAPFASAALDAITGAAPALGEAVQTESPNERK